MIILIKLMMIFSIFEYTLAMASSGASTSTQTKQSDTKLQLFLWFARDEETSDSHSIGMIATSKEDAIIRILGRLQVLKGASDAKSQFYKDLEKQGVPLKDQPFLPLPSDPQMVNCSGAWTVPPELLLSTTFRTRGNDSLTLKELLSKVDPEIYPLEKGLMFVSSALQG